ncbi:MAG: branched-chain amino acid ABC transporter substrate-binding protein, partial [Nitrospinota bacterium]
PGDDKEIAKEGVSVANKFVNAGVVGVIGHWNSHVTIPASEVYNEANIPELTVSSNARVTERGFKNIFRLFGRDDDQARTFAQFITEVLKKKTIVILDDKTAYGQSLADEVERLIKDRIQVLMHEHITTGDKDFSAILTRIKAMKPDIFFYGGYYPEAGLLLKQGRELGLDTIYINDEASVDPQLITIAGEAANGTYISQGTPLEETEALKSFKVRFKKRFGREPGIWAFYSYDGANILLNAIKETGGTDPDKVIEAIRNTDYVGVTGKFQYNEKGDRVGIGYIIYKIEDGKFIPYWSPFKGML